MAQGNPRDGIEGSLLVNIIISPAPLEASSGVVECWDVMASRCFDIWERHSELRNCVKSVSRSRKLWLKYAHLSGNGGKTCPARIAFHTSSATSMVTKNISARCVGFFVHHFCGVAFVDKKGEVILITISWRFPCARVRSSVIDVFTPSKKSETGEMRQFYERSERNKKKPSRFRPLNHSDAQ